MGQSESSGRPANVTYDQHFSALDGISEGLLPAQGVVRSIRAPGQAPTGYEAKNEAYVTYLVHMEQLLQAWSSGRLAHLDAVQQSAELTARMRALGEIDAVGTRILLEARGLNDERRVAIEEQWRHLLGQSGAQMQR
eukprot:TRINITY_DN49441_c0_g1_i1.p2 TRINITY_DN49441_c0_g1~~TRINITY_DN49441_c0_g1_i1.p2  ORF type:complete len:137 (-),score=25.30 TRINITY_DN49441_c0_g1_i1:96-506(-)